MLGLDDAAVEKIVVALADKLANRSS
jgi:hypothetical protein